MSMAKSSLTYEWTINNVAALFDKTKSSAANEAPQCSRAFGGGRWRLFFHANNGRPGFDGYVGVFLQCEPTLEEKRSDIMGRWSRPGRYSFTVDLQTVDADQTLVTVSTREDVVFTHEKRQWGWPDYATRQDVFENCLTITMHDALVLTCTINAIPPTPAPSIGPSPAISSITLPAYSESAIVHGHNNLPAALTEVLRKMVDDASISDVQFVFPRSNSQVLVGQDSEGGTKLHEKDTMDSNHGHGKVRVIWARKDILALRSEYFAKLFAESPINGPSHITTTSMPTNGVGSAPASPVATREEPTTVSEKYPFHSRYPDNSFQALQYGAEDEDGETDVTNQAGGYHADHRDHHSSHSSSQKKKIIYVNDIPYSTYRALIYYLYTDSIVFAPLASQFDALQLEEDSHPIGGLTGPTNRLDWLRIWKSENRGYAMPCSAKSMYAVATRFKLPNLRRIAYEFIRRNLTPSNLPFEYFDSFSAAHKDLKELALQGMVAHWEDIQSSPAMQEVWAKIALGEMPFAKDLLPLLVNGLARVPR